MFAARLRHAYPKVLARLLGFTRELSNAEDAVQEAVLRALKTWPAQGLPQQPEAWLITVAKNIYRDRLRQQSRDQNFHDALSILADHCPYPWTSKFIADSEDSWQVAQWRDDRLRLLLVTCDPVLTLEERVALTLATTCGLSNLEIARAFLVAPKTMEQRITRAKRRLRSRRQEYRIPDPQVLPQHLSTIHGVLHLVYNEGYWSSKDQHPIRPQLCRLALSLVHSVATMLPESCETQGLLALLIFHEARLPARLDRKGNPVPLPEQDRSQWNLDKIGKGEAILQNALLRSQGHPGEYQLEAAISAVHMRAKTAEETDWPQIAELYGLLFHHRPTPVVQIHQAFAISQAQGPAKGLLFFDAIEGLDKLQNYTYAALIRGAMLAELGRVDEAKFELERAATLSNRESEVTQIRERMAKLGAKTKKVDR